MSSVKSPVKSIRVVSALIEENGRYLITQRRPTAVQPLKWEFPGGRVEEGDSDEDTLRLKVKRRLDVDIEVGEDLATIFHEYDGYSVTMVVRRARLASSVLRAKLVNDFRWVTLAELESYEFPSADQATMDELLGMASKGDDA